MGLIEGLPIGLPTVVSIRMTRVSKTIPADAEWFFFSGGASTPRYGDDPTKHAVDHDTETFVREVLQNANDQRLGDIPVEVTFRIISLTGDEREDFLRTIDWDTELKPRLSTIAADDRGGRYDRFVQRMADPDAELRLLVVEDRHATGLTGDWNEDSNYAALVRDELYSNKQEDTAGGSYGLGKSVLWTFSAASTAVFNSTPADINGRDVEPPRLIGRTKLPTHRLDGGPTYQGAGWLCRTVGEADDPRPASLWGEEASALAERLNVARPDVSGTSAMIIGYEDPTRDERPDLDDLADEFVRAAVKYFWPAIYRDDLRVSVETPEGHRSAELHEVPEIRPFVDCFEARYDDSETLSHPGDVAGLDIPVKLPPRADETETPDGPIRLAARLASPADDDTYLNRVALFRGSGMVVKYYDQNRIAFGDRNFHAVLACGRARSSDETTDSDREIDRFLRFSEPPAHDEWESTEHLRDQYQRGYRTALDTAFQTVRDGLRHLIANGAHEEQGLSDRVLKRFPIHGFDRNPQPPQPEEPAFEIRSRSTFDDDRWIFSGEIEPIQDDFEGWSAEISLTGLGEDGSAFNEIPIGTLEADTADVRSEIENGHARLVGGPDASDVEFKGESEPLGDGDVTSGRIGETQLEIRAELREADNDGSDEEDDI